MTQDGEPFTQDELDEMLEIAIDPHTQTVPYEYYINQLMVKPFYIFYKFVTKFSHQFEPKSEKNIYILADRILKENLPPTPVPTRRLSEFLQNLTIPKF